MKKVFLTGITGLVGSAFVVALLVTLSSATVFGIQRFYKN